MERPGGGMIRPEDVLYPPPRGRKVICSVKKGMSDIIYSVVCDSSSPKPSSRIPVLLDVMS